MRGIIKFLLLNFVLIYCISCSNPLVKQDSNKPGFKTTVYVLKKPSWVNSFVFIRAVHIDKAILGDKKISQIVVTDPSQKSTILRHTTLFGNNAGFFDGFMDTAHGKLFLLIHYVRNLQDVVQKGVYSFDIEFENGEKVVLNKYFKKGEDLITGYPDNLELNQKTRMLTWSPTKGQKSYHIRIFKGLSDDYKNIIYRSRNISVIENQFKIPDEVSLEKGQYYYFEVEAHDSPDSDTGNATYVHRSNGFSVEIEENMIQDKGFDPNFFKNLKMKTVNYPASTENLPEGILGIAKTSIKNPGFQAVYPLKYELGNCIEAKFLISGRKAALILPSGKIRPLLDKAGNATLHIIAYDFKKIKTLNSYQEISISIPAFYQEKGEKTVGDYLLYMPLNSLQPMWGGIITAGYPKFPGKISITQKEDTINALLSVNGQTVLRLSVPKTKFIKSNRDIPTFTSKNGFFYYNVFSLQGNLALPIASQGAKLELGEHPIATQLKTLEIKDSTEFAWTPFFQGLLEKPRVLAD